MEFKDIRKIASFYENNIFKKWIEAEKMYYGDVSEREQHIESWQSNISSNILQRIVKTFNSHLYDNTVNFNVVWNTEEDNKKAEAVQFVLTRAFQVSNTKPVMYEILNDALLLWEWYWRIEYEYSEDKVEFITPTGKRKFTMRKRNNPTLRYVSPFDILVDPWATSWRDARYIIERNIVSVNNINTKYKAFFQLTKKQIEDFKDNATYLFIQDYNFVKNEIIFKSNTINNINNVNTQYTFNKDYYLEVIEVWTDDTLTIYVNWNKVYEDINPYPLKRKPYIQIMYSKENGIARWTWLYNSLKDIEKTGNAIVNNYLDNLKLKTLPAFVRVAWPNAWDSVNNVLDLKPWGITDVEDPNSIQPLQLGNASPDLLSTFQFLLNEAFMLAGVNEIVMGATLQKVDRSAASTMSRVQWFKTRMLPLFDSINDAMWDIAEMWLAMVIAYNSDWKNNNIEARIFDDKTKKAQFKQIKLEDIEWQFDVIFNSMAMKNALKEVALQKQMQLFQIAWQMPIDPNTKTPIFDFTSLAKDIVNTMDLPTNVIWDKKKSEKIQKQQQLQQQLAQQQTQQQTQQQAQQWPQQNPSVNQMQQADNTATQQAKPNESWTNMLQKALNFNW